MVSYAGRFAPAVAVSLASSKGSEPATELTSSRSNTTNGDATRGQRMPQLWYFAKPSLGELRDAVVLTPEDFEAQNARILGRQK